MNDNTNPTAHTPEASGGQGGERTFTQEEVNRIVSERLARERAKTEPSPADERERALKAREARLDCREYLDSKNYPAALLDVLDNSDAEKFKASVEKLVQAFPGLTANPMQQSAREGWKPGEGRRSTTADPDPIAAAFRPKI